MNILHLNNQLNLACGVSNSIFNLAYTTRNKYKHHFLALTEDAKEKFNKAGFYPELFPHKKISLFNSYDTIKFITNYCDKNKVDIIHSHHRTFDALSFLVNKVRKTKTIVTVHNIRYDKKFISYSSDKIIAVSKYVAEHLQNHYKKDDAKIEIIENFINKDFIKITQYPDFIRASLKLKQTDFVLLYAGRFSEEKGIDILINAYESLKEKFSGMKLVLIGGGPEENYYKQLNHEKNLDIIFSKPVENIFDYLNIADLVILPSRDEAFGNIILEAGYLEKIFIGSEIGNIRNFIQDKKNGLLFQSGNYLDLAEKIQHAYINFDNLNQIGINLKNSLMDKFDEQKFVLKIQNCYER
ncbi:MAG TPA: glycosyltransferase family 4 protein [Ignavibacteria bacterium]|nr:glycosyltransferase family 4 protein [Ignavibacteria bacterium]